MKTTKRSIPRLSIPLAALLLSPGGIARGQEPGQPSPQGRPGVTRPAEEPHDHPGEKGHDHGPRGVSPAGGAGGGRSTAPT